MFEKLVAKLPWKRGRQGGDYYTITLFSSPTHKADCYLIYYKDGSCLGIHKDEVPGFAHYRANLTIKAPSRGGGELFCDRPLWITNRLKIFRSDAYHNVSCCRGWRLVLSFGWLQPLP